MVIQYCAGCVDISNHAGTELLQASSSEATSSRLASLTFTVLEEAGTTPRALLEEYSATIHPWLPIIDQDRFRSRLTNWTERREPEVTILIWALYLVAMRPCTTLLHSMQTLVYRTVRQMFTLQASEILVLETLQSGLLIAYYACGHGFSRDAHITLATCVTQARLMGLTLHEIRVGPSADTELSACKWAIVLIDRYACGLCL